MFFNYNGVDFVANPVGSDWDFSVGVELVTVPVPATAWLFVSALAVLAGVFSCRRLKQQFSIAERLRVLDSPR